MEEKTAKLKMIEFIWTYYTIFKDFEILSTQDDGRSGRHVFHLKKQDLLNHVLYFYDDNLHSMHFKDNHTVYGWGFIEMKFIPKIIEETT